MHKKVLQKLKAKGERLEKKGLIAACWGALDHL
jgi:hypothetical protein